MLKKVMVMSALAWSCSAVAMAETGCDQVCLLGHELVKQSSPIDQMGIRTGEVSLIGKQVLVQALVYGEQSDAAYREIMANPQQSAASQQLTKEEVTKGVCASPLFRDFLKAGGSVRHEIRLQRDGSVFYENVMRECPNA